MLGDFLHADVCRPRAEALCTSMKPLPASSAGLTPGAVFDSRYRLDEPIGFGGMGQVWSATNESLGTPVAIKVLHGNVVEDDDARQRFIREARVMESLGDMSRHITRVIDHGVLVDGVPYLIMERLHGEGLDLRLKRQKVMPLAEVADLVSQLCKALAVTHAEQIIHRDIKPANIFLCPEPGARFFVKLLDFGVVKVMTEVGESTGNGQIIGTPNYMAPEQLTPKAPIDHRADLFALGAIIYRCATGRVAFGKGTPQEMVQRVLHEMPPVPSTVNAELPPEFDAFMARALAKRPEERFASAREMADALQRIVDDPVGARSSISLERSSQNWPAQMMNVDEPSFTGRLSLPTPKPISAGSAAPVSAPTPKKSSSLWIVLAALLVVGGVVGVLALRG